MPVEAAEEGTCLQRRAESVAAGIVTEQLLNVTHPSDFAVDYF